MSNNTNRMIIVGFAGFLIVLMFVLIFLAWTASSDVIDEISDFADYLGHHDDTAGKLIVTLGSLVVVVMSLLLIILELAPEEEERELRVQQAGATSIVPAAALKQRLEEALVALPAVTAARARVSARDRGIASTLDLTVAPATNVADVTQEAARVVTDTIETDLGLPLAGVPAVRVAFGAAKRPVASSMAAPPVEGESARPPEIGEVETVDERIAAGPGPSSANEGAPAEQQPEATAGSSPGPIVYEASQEQGAPAQPRPAPAGDNHPPDEAGESQGATEPSQEPAGDSAP
ncbi:MAG: hypothetical protein E6J42_07040 [Chloroflexi bacterium]|nr:MAG: hypothetical protein E6J42_07040 [Chloroflexota bacterium]